MGFVPLMFLKCALWDTCIDYGTPGGPAFQLDLSRAARQGRAQQRGQPNHGRHKGDGSYKDHPFLF